MEFVAFDVETANSDPGSICQVGLAFFNNGILVDRWGTYINPQTHFDLMNVRIHGINQDKVKNSPTLSQIKDRLKSYFNNRTVVTYTNFDQIALRRNNLEFECDWLDASLIVRRTWEKVAFSGYGLSNVCIMNKIKMEKHHDAESDAIAAGMVLLKAMEHHGIDLNGAKNLINRRISTLFKNGKMLDTPHPKDMIIEGGNHLGRWYGEVLCFTGELSISRTEAAIIASQAGFNVKNSITKKTTYLVKGVQDLTKLNGKTISSKEEKAIEAINQGADMIIIGENEFFELIKD